MKSFAGVRNAGIQEGDLQDHLNLLVNFEWTHLNLLHPSSALAVLLNPLSTLLTLWYLACKPFDDVHGQ